MSVATQPDTGIDAVIAGIAFDADGLVPAIAQQYDTGEVLMLAWMSREAVRETLATGRVCYFSRRRQSLWRKGESSGQSQALIDFRIDCDGDAVLLLVDQTGVACHTGARRCFFRRASASGLDDMPMARIDPARLYGSARP
jgi:phosphoribosyl-AMP cyclohydrolase